MPLKQYRTHLLVCAGTGCVSSGSFKIKEALEKEIQKRKLEDEVLIIATGCNGFCEQGPILMVHPDGIFYQKLQVKDIPYLVEEHILKGRPVKKFMFVPPAETQPVPKMKDIEFFKHQKLIVLRNRGRIDPEKIEEYIAFDGYEALGKALGSMTPEAVIEEITAAGLRGRGGAGFPTGKKWLACRLAKGSPKYLVCNGDEGDPGAFMDRSVLEADPHGVLEGMIIGAKAVGAEKGFIYIRREYPLALKRMDIAISQARERGLLGKDILGTGFDFDAEVVQGAGAFVSGEETALLASIEGRIAMPRQRPPYPAQKGLWGKPTVINNVETWATVPNIIRRGSAWFSALGTKTSKGTKIFSLVGKINNTGLVEVPMGITLRDIIFGIGGGIPGGGKFKAVQTGGPSGGCLPASKLDLPIDYEGLAAAGSIMGSGGMIVMDDKTCMVDLAKYFLNFLRDESCGKCVSCREGTQRMWEIVTRITEGKGKEEDIGILEDLAAACKDASMCALGQTAANPVLSTLRYFKDEYRQHIRRKKCPAQVCKEIVSSPCQYVCPIGQEASTYIALIASGQYEDAFKIIMKDNPLPSVCARVCHHPCELHCRAGESGEPISIRSLKRFVTDWADKNGITYVPKKVEHNREKIAIIGAGPAGLTAGYFLAQKGFRPTIFEALSVPGGMLAVGIPDHRLPGPLVQKEIEQIRNAGVDIRLNKTLGRDITIDGLFKSGYKAVYCATGAGKSLHMGIPGEDAEGVLHSLEYLRQINMGKKVAIGKRVVVVGGGNSAIDAARVALRDPACEEVTIFYRRTKAEMPAIAEDVEAAIEEGVDIRFLVTPVKVLMSYGKAVEIECVKMKLGELDSSGRPKPVPIEGSNFIHKLDTLILAISERPDTSYIGEGDEINRHGENIVIDEETAMTTRAGVFAGGDAVTGPNMVVDAMAAGKKAAEMIAQYVEGKPLKPDYKLSRPSLYVAPPTLSEEEILKARRPKMNRLSTKSRANNFKEVELGLSEKAAIQEARRCLRCDLETEDGKAAIKAMKEKS
ncbi:MAG: NADH-quinone oxidoreductase subunit NuoF [Candidatus Aminicenantes bacterium]|nr:NADH-quinone oxidoreductase subunit NuoF [Candidatus Aminicenantes bacterium]